MQLPVDTPTLAAFTAAALAIVLSPGPDTFIILRYTLSSGRRVGLATMTGVQLGIMLHTVLAVIGLTVLILSLPTLYRSIAALGAAYLAYLGVQSFRAGILSFAGTTPQISAMKGLRDALFTNLLNPKVILLFVALMPNFVEPARGQLAAQFVTLGVSLLIINTIWQLILVFGAEALRPRLLQARVQRAINAVTGAVLFAFALLMLVEHVF